MNEHTSGCIRQVRREEQAAVFGHGGCAREQVLEHGQPDVAGMDALTHLRQLLRVAEQHQVAGGGAHRDRVCQRHLPRFVDEQVVERAVHLLAREQP